MLVRVVGGVAGGRILHAPTTTATRPTSERVREAIFSILSSLRALDGASVLDLFAGSGALGIEAISRGAGRAVFVESTGPGVDAIYRNLAVLGERRNDATVVRDDAVSYARRCGYFDIVIADPPYAFERWAELAGHLATRAGHLVVETSDQPRQGKRARSGGRGPDRGEAGGKAGGEADGEAGGEAASGAAASGAGSVDSPRLAHPGVSESLGPMWETVKVKRYGGTVVLVVRPLVTVCPAEEGNI